jgi:hypothetical protein
MEFGLPGLSATESSVCCIGICELGFVDQLRKKQLRCYALLLINVQSFFSNPAPRKEHGHAAKANQ